MLLVLNFCNMVWDFQSVYIIWKKEDKVIKYDKMSKGCGYMFLLLENFSSFTYPIFKNKKMKTVPWGWKSDFLIFPFKYSHLTTINANDSAKQHIHKWLLN